RSPPASRPAPSSAPRSRPRRTRAATSSPAALGTSSSTRSKPRTARASRDTTWRSSPGGEGGGSMADRRVLVIAAHPDDEVLGCGGTIARYTAAGAPVTVVIACEGESLRYGPGGVGQEDHIREAASVLGVEDVRLLGF